MIKINEQHKRIMKKINVLNPKMWTRLLTEHWPHLLFVSIYIPHFVSFFNNLNGYNVLNQGFKKPFALEWKNTMS
jgi:hypothetical protein